MHIRCTKLLSETRRYFITCADDHIQAITARNPELSVTQYLAEHPSELSLARFLTEDVTEFSLSRYLAEDAMPSEHLAPKTTLSIFLADAATAAALQKINPDAPFYSEMLQCEYIIGKIKWVDEQSH
jgi:hypothetical protein